MLNAEKLVADGALANFVNERYAGWDGAEGKAILAGERTFAQVADRAIAGDIAPQPRSGKQEYLETMLARRL